MAKCIACRKFRIGSQGLPELAKIPCFPFPNNQYRSYWLAFLTKNDSTIKVNKMSKLCLLHFHKSDHLLGSLLKSTAIPKFFGPPRKLYSLQQTLKLTNPTNSHQPRKRGNNKHLMEELQQELSTASCYDCEECANILSTAIQHLKNHRPKAPTPTFVIDDEDDERQPVTLVVKEQGNTRLYQCPCCPTEMKYPEVIAHIRSHERPTERNIRNDVTESIDLIDDSDDDSTRTSSDILAKMNFRAKKQGGNTVYVCNTCNDDVAEDIISHYAMHQVEDDFPEQVVEEMTASSDDDEEEEEIVS